MWLVALGLGVIGAPVGVRAQRPEALMGSPEKLAAQNQAADDLDLSRMTSPAAIRRMVKAGYLVSIPRRGRGFYVDTRLGSGYVSRDVLFYARPWVRRFLVREGGHFADRFDGARFKVASLIRTEGYQEKLQARNVNAARNDDDDSRSPHLTGAAVDISKKGMTAKQLAWMRDHLVQLQDLGWVIATEEMATNTFHVFVQPDFARPSSDTSKKATPKRASRK